MTRSKAMNILAAIFASFEPDLLSEVELSFIVDFLYDRLRDQHVVIPKVIHCIKAIVSQVESLLRNKVNTIARDQVTCISD